MKKILKKAYNLCINEFPDFPYLLDDIYLWLATEDEYPLTFQNAVEFLNLPVKININQLEYYSAEFKAELLKTHRKVIIILRKSLIEDPHESLKILIHELAHAYHDNVFKENAPPNDDEKKYLFQTGERMWKECVAEYFSMRILRSEEEWNQNTLERDFKSLLYNPALYPERLGFFLMRCKNSNTSAADVIKAVGINAEIAETEKLAAIMEKLQDDLNKKLRRVAVFEIDSNFLIQLGKKIAVFVYYYYQYYDYVDTFLNTMEK